MEPVTIQKRQAETQSPVLIRAYPVSSLLLSQAVVAAAEEVLRRRWWTLFGGEAKPNNFAPAQDKARKRRIQGEKAGEERRIESCKTRKEKEKVRAVPVHAMIPPLPAHLILFCLMFLLSTISTYSKVNKSRRPRSDPAYLI